ncbi:MFS transporter [Methylobacterium gnaphalii]|uniref:MFS transporter n=1 Tax=Methylobacterium gnaphalii TaxID=1010610 RepID=A0A512JFL0_9HYPH|nr:MFS transporter [Methylobacterium gnaphalii]GEP08729.1 MFS transporter [Methylobacterium gnaphalii]GJD69319.1 Sialic acid transporter NanT [Methylobacterium gnaphalii]GLS47495.1 MFS transporter [Methylobacterium gnaphalii]
MSGSASLAQTETAADAETVEPRRSLFGACLAHALHDGYTDLLYVLLPIWQTEFGLSYAGVAAMRSLYYGTMGGLQVPADRLVDRMPIRTALVLSTLVAAAGFCVMALTESFWGLCTGLLLAGIGSSIQHPRGSLLVTQAFGNSARGPLGIYNFSGDLGKAAFPVVVALLLGLFAWRTTASFIAVAGAVVAISLLPILPRAMPVRYDGKASREGSGDRRGFRLLLAIGGLDTATRMGYLLFLPFLLHTKGGDQATVGLSLALVFAGGAFGKAACGWLGEHLGVVRSVVATELATALLIAVTIPLPLTATLVVLPLIGIFLNGTSSVLYGTVPELAPRGDVGRAFALFYTAVIGSGGVAPIAYGALADHMGETLGVLAAALTALVIVPLVLGLRPALVATGSAEQA